MLAVDDVQFIAGKESTQEEFFHVDQVGLAQPRPPVDKEGVVAVGGVAGHRPAGGPLWYNIMYIAIPPQMILRSVDDRYGFLSGPVPAGLRIQRRIDSGC